MNREQKAVTVAALNASFNQATVMLVASAQGLSVGRLQQLRRALRQAGGEYKVAKNTLTRRAVKNTAYSRLEELLQGPTGLVFGYADPVAVTKVLVRFAEQHDQLSIKAAVLDSRLLEPAAVRELATLPARDELLGMLLGVLQAPASQLLRTIQEPGARFVRLLARARSQDTA